MFSECHIGAGIDKDHRLCLVLLYVHLICAIFVREGILIYLQKGERLIYLMCLLILQKNAEVIVREHSQLFVH